MSCKPQNLRNRPAASTLPYGRRDLVSKNFAGHVVPRRSNERSGCRKQKDGLRANDLPKLTLNLRPVSAETGRPPPPVSTLAWHHGTMLIGFGDADRGLAAG